MSYQQDTTQGGELCHIGNWSHIKARDQGRFVQFEDSCVLLHRLMDGKIQVLKCAEENQVEQEVISAYSI